MQRLSKFYGKYRSGEKIRGPMVDRGSKMKHIIVGSANERLRRLLQRAIAFDLRLPW